VSHSEERSVLARQYRADCYEHPEESYEEQEREEGLHAQVLSQHWVSHGFLKGFLHRVYTTTKIR